MVLGEGRVGGQGEQAANKLDSTKAMLDSTNAFLGTANEALEEALKRVDEWQKKHNSLMGIWRATNPHDRPVWEEAGGMYVIHKVPEVPMFAGVGSERSPSQGSGQERRRDSPVSGAGVE